MLSWEVDCYLQSSCTLFTTDAEVNQIQNCGVDGIQSGQLGGFAICEEFLISFSNTWVKSDVYTIFIIFDFFSIFIFAIGYFV